jgi:hypothetical protein
VFVAAATDLEFRKEASDLGTIGVLDKPLDPDALISLVVERFPVPTSKDGAQERVPAK